MHRAGQELSLRGLITRSQDVCLVLDTRGRFCRPPPVGLGVRVGKQATSVLPSGFQPGRPAVTSHPWTAHSTAFEQALAGLLTLNRSRNREARVGTPELGPESWEGGDFA